MADDEPHEGELRLNNPIDYYRRMADAQDREAEREARAKTDDEQLAGAYRVLEQFLGPDADVIIGIIQGTVDKKRAAAKLEDRGGA